MQTLNKYFLKRATVVYFISLVVCVVLYSSHSMAWYWMLAGIVEVSLFYVLSTYLEIRSKKQSSVSFERQLFGGTLLLRLLWVIGFYLFTMNVWNTPWEQPIGTSMDSTGYFDEALWLREMILNKDISPYLMYISASLDDAGYPIFLGILSLLTNENILLTRLPNIVFDAWTVVLTYRIAKRNFGENVARVAGIFTMLMPMLLFYSGVTMKETLMLMLVTWAIERGDYTIRNHSFAGMSFVSFLLLTASILLFRKALAVVVALSFICALLLSSKKVIDSTRRVTIILIMIIGGFIFVGGEGIMDQSNELVEQVESSEINFEYRANRQGGNVLVRNLSKAMLAPAIFTLPFPTMVEIEGQNIQQLQNGGFYLKNVLSFFVIFSLIVLLKRRTWRENVMIIAYLIGYLLVLSLSSFAHSGRFHHPVIPIEMIFAALGISFVKNKKQADLFDYFLFFEFLVIIFWNGFKLKGRGIL